jgi:hypothetical protein
MAEPEPESPAPESTLAEPVPGRNNPDPSGNIFVGDVYVFQATGGFTMERGFDTIKLAEQTAPEHVDVTDAIQIVMAAEIFNDLLDLTSFDVETDSFGVDEITLDAAGLIAGVTSGEQVLSVGKYSTLYSDFQAYVTDYFSIDGGFSSLFVAASEFAIDESNVFDGESFVALLNGVAQDPSGRYISELAGSITIANIAKILKYSVDSNVFGNRGTDIKNWGVEDGFVPGDLIWVPEGTTVTLKLAIDPEAFAPLNNKGSDYGSATATEHQESVSGLFSLDTTATTELITRVAKAPLLIKLVL